MAYNKNEKTRDNRLKSEKSNRYTFKWSYEYRHKAMTLPLLTFVISCVLMIFLCPNALKKKSPILEVIFIVGFGVAFLLYNLAIFQNLIHHTEILPDKITIVPLLGKATVLDGVQHIERVQRTDFDADNTTYILKLKEREETRQDLDFTHQKLVHKKFGEFTQHCVNFDEIAMVTCADGKKYLINYPRELQEKTV